MKKQFIIWGVVLLTVINVASLATIGYHRFIDVRGDRHDRRLQGRQTFQQELGLSAAQVAQMDTLRKTLEERIKPFRGELKTKRKLFYGLIMTPENKRIEIEAVSGEIDSLQAVIKKHVINHMLAHKDILTPEQQEKFFSRMMRRYSNGYWR